MQLWVTNGRVRVWRQDNSLFVPNHIQTTLEGGGGPVIIWGCVSCGCKTNLMTLQKTLNG